MSLKQIITSQKIRKRDSVNLTILLMLIISLLGCQSKRESKIQKIFFYKKSNIDSFNEASFRIYKKAWYIKFNQKDSKIILNKYKSIDSLKIKTIDTVYSVECDPLLGGVKHKSLLLTPVNDNIYKMVVFEKIDDKGRLMLKLFAPFNDSKKPEKVLRDLVTDKEYEEMQRLSWKD